MIKGERVSWGQNKDRRKKNDQATQLGFWLFLESLQMEGWWNGMVIHEDRITYVKEDTQACRCFTQQVFPANNRTRSSEAQEAWWLFGDLRSVQRTDLQDACRGIVWGSRMPSAAQNDWLLTLQMDNWKSTYTFIYVCIWIMHTSYLSAELCITVYIYICLLYKMIYIYIYVHIHTYVYLYL